MVDDLEPVGWEVLLTAASDRVMRDVENRMKDAVCLWLYGVTLGQRPRALRLQVSEDALFTLRAPDDVERQAMIDEAIEDLKMWAACKNENRADLRSRAAGCLLEAASLPSERGERCKAVVPKSLMEKWRVTAGQLFDARDKIRKVAQECL